MIGKKICSLCKGEFEITSFNVNKKSRDGLHAWCKVCCRKAEKERYKILHDQRIQEVREWQQKNLDKVREYKKNWRDKQKPVPPTEGSSPDLPSTPSQ